MYIYNDYNNRKINRIEIAKIKKKSKLKQNNRIHYMLFSYSLFKKIITQK